MQAAKQFVYPVTPGRSGTVFLYELLRANWPGAEIHHERTGFPNFGVRTPDASQITTFNSVGNTKAVRSFWRHKLELDAATEAAAYCEISHFLGKAGLMENLDLLPRDSRIDIVALRRDRFRTLWSFVNRLDFLNDGSSWLVSLDAKYPNVIVDSEPYGTFGMLGNALWYVDEMFARQAYYQRWLEGRPGVHFHLVELKSITTELGAGTFLRTLGLPAWEESLQIPERRDAEAQEFFGRDERSQAMALLDHLNHDPDVLGRAYYDEGFRLGTPVHLATEAAAKPVAAKTPRKRGGSGRAKPRRKAVPSIPLARIRVQSGSDGDLGLSS